ncbi:50S ribosomal protein L13 [Candidatus Babeliales bacterium]|nr:50S ribosomal protein L13 [Candidatus Babeliales bacterium]
MNKAFSLKVADRDPAWRVMDADGAVLGRLATQVANALRGKDKVTFTPHVDSGDYVIIINCEKVVMTGKKWDQKIYRRHSGWRGGLRTPTAREVYEKDPTRIITHAVKGMLPTGPMGRHMLSKLKVYVGSEHPHQAQVK